MAGLTLTPNAGEAHLVGIGVSMFLWGFYTSLFIRTLRVLRQKRYALYSLTTICICLCAVFNVLNTIAIMVWAFKGFVSYPAGPDVYFTLISIKAIDTKWIALFDFTLAAAAISGDTLMIWRLYVVWARKKHVVILPIILEVIGIASCGVIVYYDVAAGTRLQEPGFASQIYAITVVVFIINITTTFYLTGFICYRLYSSERRTRSVDDYDVHARGSPYWKIIKVLIQSGALYSMTEATFLICILARCTNGTTVMAYLDARLIGIVTTLIVLQLNNSGDSTTTTVSLPRAHATIGTYSVRVTKHTQVDVKSDGPIEDIELSPVNPDDPIKSSVWE